MQVLTVGELRQNRHRLDHGWFILFGLFRSRLKPHRVPRGMGVAWP